MTPVMRDNEFIIANPIYDVAFERLMADTDNVLFFIETLLDLEVSSVEIKPQTCFESIEALLQLQSYGVTRFLRTDFIATIKTAAGDSQKILIEFCKGKKSLSSGWFRRHLTQRYRPANEVKVPLHTITIYILASELKHLPSPAAKITRQYIDLITKQPLSVKENFSSNFHHDYIIIQTSRIHHVFKTELEALLGLFEQNDFVDDNGHFKKSVQPLINERIRRMIKALSRVVNSKEDHLMLDAEDSLSRIVNGDFNEEMQQLRYKLKIQTEKTEQIRARTEQICVRTKQALAEKEK
jgi:hypothetical protein